MCGVEKIIIPVTLGQFFVISDIKEYKSLTDRQGLEEARSLVYLVFFVLSSYLRYLSSSLVLGVSTAYHRSFSPAMRVVCVLSILVLAALSSLATAQTCVQNPTNVVSLSSHFFLPLIFCNCPIVASMVFQNPLLHSLLAFLSLLDLFLVLELLIFSEHLRLIRISRRIGCCRFG